MIITYSVLLQTSGRIDHREWVQCVSKRFDEFAVFDSPRRATDKKPASNKTGTDARRSLDRNSYTCRYRYHKKILVKTFFHMKLFNAKYFNTKFLGTNFLTPTFFNTKFVNAKFFNTKFLTRNVFTRNFLTRNFWTRIFLTRNAAVPKHLYPTYCWQSKIVLEKPYDSEDYHNFPYDTENTFAYKGLTPTEDGRCGKWTRHNNVTEKPFYCFKVSTKCHILSDISKIIFSTTNWLIH